MPYHADLIVDYKAFDAYKRFIQTYYETVNREIKATFYGEIAQPMLEDFRWYPRESQNSLNSGQPFVWSENHEANRRAAAWYHANFPHGRPRTGTLAKNYEVGITESDDALAVFVRNKTPYYKFVKGRRQIPGHKRTGWRQDSETFMFWRNRVREMTVKVVKRIVPNL